MAKRKRKNELKVFLSDDEQYMLEQKVKISGMKSKSAFLRRLILYALSMILTIPIYRITTIRLEKSAAT